MNLFQVSAKEFEGRTIDTIWSMTLLNLPQTLLKALEGRTKIIIQEEMN